MKLLDVTRNGHVESWHRGSLVFLDSGSAVSRSAGEVEAPIFPRSSLKPLQAVAMLECGFAGRDESLALAAASHDGEDVHVATARSTLAGAGLGESALQCPPALPSGPDALIAWIADGGRAARICHNCSGKHAAMLATCAGAGWPIASYRSPSHPLQAAIRMRISELCGTPVADVAVDGCGAPAFSLSLTALAHGFAVLAGSASGPAHDVADAMRRFPRLIGGTGRAVSELSAAVPGLVCKEGAEGVWAAALPDGRAFAAKIDDGSARGLGPLLAAALRHWGFDDAVVVRWSEVAVLGGGAPVGAISPSRDLRALLGI